MQFQAAMAAITKILPDRTAAAGAAHLLYGINFTAESANVGIGIVKLVTVAAGVFVTYQISHLACQ